LYAGYAEKAKLPKEGVPVDMCTVPTLWWLAGAGRNSPLAATLHQPLRRTLEKSIAENGKERSTDYGCQAIKAEGFLLAAGAYNEKDFEVQALVLLHGIMGTLDRNFWEFNCGSKGSMLHGNQLRPFGHGHASLSNTLAWLRTGKPEHLAAARRFARFMVGICYATTNGSNDPDFDWRGWANGSITGMDQLATCPPWETMQGLMSMAVLLDACQAENGLYDALWWISRTGLGAYPAARRFKRALSTAYQERFVPRAALASERDFYDGLPYLAYENPIDQTMLASYQGTDALLAELVFGGGLARATDPRLGVFVPEAYTMNPELQTRRTVHVWNPTPQAIRADIIARWPNGQETRHAVSVDGRKAARLTLAH